MSGMVEVPHIPAVRVMALGAVLTEAAAVDIILGVATHTFLWRIVESLSGMTLAAGHDHMQSHQRVL